MSEYIAGQEGVSEYNIALIKTVALFHDVGFIQSNAEGHEEESIRLAKKNYLNIVTTKRK